VPCCGTLGHRENAAEGVGFADITALATYGGFLILRRLPVGSTCGGL
jgi:hypothetical protein